MADDLRERYDELVRASDARKQKALEIRAQHAAIKARQQETATELKTLGIDDPSQLDEIIAAEEREIAGVLQQVEQQLKDIDAGNMTPLLPKAPKPQQEMASLDELLARGSE